MILLVTLWTAELYWVQSVTLVYPNIPGPRFAFFRAPKIRLVLDLLFVSALSLWLRPRWLVVTLVGSSLAYLGLVTYFHYFLRPLSFWTLATSWREGLQLSGFVFDLFPKRWRWGCW